MHLNRRYLLLAILIAAVYSLFGAGLVLTRAPFSDEGVLGNAGYLFLTKGYLAMPTLETAGFPQMRGLDRYLYWNMPLYMMSAGGWFYFFGTSVFALRSLSLVCGLLAAVSWSLVILRLTQDKRLALLCFALVTWNYDFVNISSAGRLDSMCVAFYAAGMAAYLFLRERNLAWAMLASHSLLALSLMTHPFAGFGMFAVVVLMIVFDRRRIGLRHLAVAAVPYLIAVGCWGLYALQEPEIARDQLLYNVGAGRLGGFSRPLATLWREIQQRYVTLFAGWRPGVPLAMRLKLLVLGAYWVAFVAVLATPWMRRRKGYGILLSLTAADFVLLTYFENLKWYAYLAHIIPVYSCVLGAMMLSCWDARGNLPAPGDAARRPGEQPAPPPGTGPLARIPRWLIATAAACLLIFHLGSVAYRTRLNQYHRTFLPAAEYLKKAARPGDLIMASSEFAFITGFDGRVIEDYRLGFYSGKAPVFIVVEKQLQEWLDSFRTNPELHRHVQRQLSHNKVLLFEVAHGGDWYRIYGPPRQ